MTEDLVFPSNFLWGVSTSAHQFEGGNDLNQWSEWEQRGGVHTGERSGRACNWWVDPEPDFDLAKGLGLNALRLSVEWSRVEPREGHWDDRALERYRTMLTALRSRGIRPWVCLHHFTHPLWFERRGGFRASDSPRRFERFARHVAEGLGDVCSDWVTFNEPNVYLAQGYQIGEFPPGRRGDTLGLFDAMRNMRRAHAAAYRTIHTMRTGAQVGFTQNLFLFDPVRPRSRLDRFVTAIPELAYNHAFLDAVAFGRFPGLLGRVLPAESAARGTLDYVGINYYGRFRIAFDPWVPGELCVRRVVPTDAPQGDHGHAGAYCECVPDGIATLVERVAAIGKPIYVLENGVPDATDRIRPWLIAQTTRALHGAIQRGVDVRGYFHWSLVDNFEWAEGWKLRFGLIAMDPVSQQRTPRPSASLYGAIARANALRRQDVERYVGSTTYRMTGSTM